MNEKTFWLMAKEVASYFSAKDQMVFDSGFPELKSICVYTREKRDDRKEVENRV